MDRPKMIEMHKELMDLKFPYHSVSVIYRSQDLGHHVIFGADVKCMVSESVKELITSNGFTYSQNQ